MAKYKITSWSNEDAVEIPELDAFLADLDVVFKKHGVGLEATGEEYSHYIMLSRYEDVQSAIIDINLSDSSEKIPWLAAAIEREKILYSARLKRERQEAEARASDEAKAKERHIIERGLIVGGKHYRLTPNDEG